MLDDRTTSQTTAVVIPALDPDGSLITLSEQLAEWSDLVLVIVDDGSHATSTDVFAELEGRGHTVLHHATRQGKGTALKTGLAYVQAELPHCDVIVTADADGQHLPADIVHVAATAREHQGALVLGERTFSQEEVPLRSRFGNKFSAWLFRALYGLKVHDTQTGLRSFDRTLLPLLERVKGTRYEYEANMLIECARQRCKVVTVPIETVYLDNNSASHFSPVRDSLRVLGTAISGIFKFATSSLAGSAVDLIAAWLLFELLRPMFLDPGQQYLRIVLATALARALSIAVNYSLNKRFVFRDKGRIRGSLARYLVLAVCLITLSAAGVYALSTLTGMSEQLAKVLTDIVLFFLSFVVQRAWVFTGKAVRSGTQ